MKKEITPEEALMRLESLCARSEQCTEDVRRKLYMWKIPQSTAEKIIDHLIDNRYIDDTRFASAFTRDKFRFNRWGKVKISHWLTQKHIPKEVINDALDEIDDEEYEETLIDLLRSKAKTIDNPDSFDGKTRMFRFALSRGFDPTLAIEAIKSRKWLQEE